MTLQASQYLSFPKGSYYPSMCENEAILNDIWPL